jgi:hypothetical protein
METLLKELLRQQHLKYETFCAAYREAALAAAPDDVPPSRAQYYRWLSGQLKGGIPYPDACRVLETMFAPWKAADLFGPYQAERHVLRDNGSAVSPGGLLESVPGAFAASALQGHWVTCYQFSHGELLHHHADIAHVTVVSNHTIHAMNHPPSPQTEGRVMPFRNEIEAQLANRHLIGCWKNTSDARYFGTLHLAVLPGELVMEGYYTGFASDIGVSSGPWRWVRLHPQGLDAVATITLRNPAVLYKLVMDHSQYDAPLTLADIREDA